MATRLVVGLFPSSGIALDAYHRLHTEGIPAGRLAHRVLKEVGPPPPNVEIELEMLAVDPLVLGDVRHTFAPFIRNGESAVFVGVDNDDEALFAADILRLYQPMTIASVPAQETDNPP